MDVCLFRTLYAVVWEGGPPVMYETLWLPQNSGAPSCDCDCSGTSLSLYTQDTSSMNKFQGTLHNNAITFLPPPYSGNLSWAKIAGPEVSVIIIEVPLYDTATCI